MRCPKCGIEMMVTQRTGTSLKLACRNPQCPNYTAPGEARRVVAELRVTTEAAHEPQQQGR